MMSVPRLLRIIVVCLRYRLDELVLSGIAHPVAYRLLWLVRLGSRPKMARGLRLRLALELPDLHLSALCLLHHLH